MALSSMTGFGRAEGSHGAWRWSWELRTVNGRNLDVRLRLPAGFERLDPEVRRRIGKRIARGSVQVGFQVAREEGSTGIRVNEAVLEAVLALTETLKDRIDAAPPSLDGLLALRGVLEPVEPEESEADVAAREAALLSSFDEALDRLAAARGEEGARLGAILEGQVAEIERLSAAADAFAKSVPDRLRDRLKTQIADLLGAGAPVPEDRLAQELALLVTKADIREEIDRLAAHSAAARELLTKPGAIGRRLDFLVQEFNREANTLCSKAADIELTRIGLDLKAVIDQLKEQTQNLE
jgi:uncharacterized protein (TIGR00255 family)